jgi:hypothetical protein
MTERMAWVPQAFWMVWPAKKRFSGREVTKVPSRGWVVFVEGGSRIHLKRKMTP